MAANDALTAGIRPGGLTDRTQIRLLLCYLIKNSGPLSRQEVEDAIMAEELVNYFEISPCLDDITAQGLVTQADGLYTATQKGCGVANELASALPRSVRDRAVAAVLRCQTWAHKNTEYAAEIINKRDDGYCTVRCTIRGIEKEFFCLDIGAPDDISAELIKRRFILKGDEVYRLLIDKLDEEEQL